MRGFIQVKGVYVQKGKYADVEIVFFGETANLSRDIGDGMLTDLDLSSYNHTLNATNISEKLGRSGSLSSGAIRYGLPGQGAELVRQSNRQHLDNINPLEHGDFTPYFRASEMMTQILTTAGYTYSSTFLCGLDDLYLLANRGSLSVFGYDATSGDQIPPEQETMIVGLATDLT